MLFRSYKGAPAPLNLAVPPHVYLSDTTLLIGEDRMAFQIEPGKVTLISK